MSPSPSHPIGGWRDRGGFALVIVLIALALITALTVFFMSNVGRERRGVDQYSRGSEARHFADTAVNLVMGQINAATKEGVAAPGATPVPVSWASQPGMIRTYKTDGTLSNAYKLYSWDNLVETGSGFNPNNATSELPSSTWFTLPSQYTDLNAPVNGVYPIADPTIANDGSGSRLAPDTVNPEPPWDFPAEFSVLKDPTKGYYAQATNALPMPVKWLYVLQDGTWVAPTSANGNVASFTGLSTAQTPTAANPIVGRMAFWTDDETSKVNINTASEGSFWDTPKAATEDEMQFAGNPPARGEFQRISGHPATTSLSAVFPEMRSNGFSRWNGSGGAANSIYLQEIQDLYSLTPRIDWGSSLSSLPKQGPGGSQGGTAPVNSYTATYAPSFISGNTGIFLDSDRLYASADDLWFQPSRTPNVTFGYDAAGNLLSNVPHAALTPSQMAKRLFLLTANSRAPETTLFETPRISLWPVTWPYSNTVYHITGNRTKPLYPTMTPDPTNLSANPTMSYQERLLAFDSTLNQNASTPLPYYFQRQAPDSPFYDWTNIQRNQDLVGYLAREMRQPFPGMGNSLGLDDSAKWGTINGDWIALNCFDFSRSLINQYTYNQTTPTGTDSDYLYTYTGIRTSSGRLNNGTAPAAYAEPNAYSVVPLHVPLNGSTYTTEGAFPALKEACLVFYATQRDEPKGPVVPNPPPVPLPSNLVAGDPRNWTNLILNDNGTGSAATNQSRTKQMQAVMLLSFSGMNPGVWSWRGQTYFSPVFWVKVSRAGGANSFLVNGSDIDFPSANGNVVQYSTNTAWSSHFMAPMPASLFTHDGQTKSFTYNLAYNPSTDYLNWSLVSKPIDSTFGITADKTSFSFTGSKIQIDIYAPESGGDLTKDPTVDATGAPSTKQLICSQQIDFSGWTSPSAARLKPLPIPIAPRWNVHQGGSTAVPIPDRDNTTYNTAAVPGWQTEVVPVLNILSTLNILGSDPRVATSGTGNCYLIGTTNTEPVPYAYTDSNGGLGSRSFMNRANAVRYSATSPLGEGGGTALYYGSSQPQVYVQAYQLITPYDTAISMVSDPSVSPTGVGAAGDARLMGRGNNTSPGNMGATTFVPIDTAIKSVLGTAPPPQHVVAFTQPYQRATDQAQYHTLSTIPGMRFPTGYWLDYQFSSSPSLITSTPNPNEIGIFGLYTQGGGLLLGRSAGDTAVGVDTNVTNSINSAWDWTTLPGNFGDGGYINRPDQDYQVVRTGINSTTSVPYFNDAGLATSNTTSSLATNVFVPNRQIPSPVILGTLPSSMATGWQTLNFCPNPAKAMNVTGGTHPGLGKQASPTAAGAAYTALPDHLLLDLFWMPVAEPYPISDQLSTAGKVNLNYAMMPFPYIQRKTALDAVLKSVYMAALPSSSTAGNFARAYKSYGQLYALGRLDQTQTRFPVDVATTLKAFDYKFNQGDIFRSASQVCDMFLYPNSAAATAQSPGSALATDTPPSTTGITGWWAQHALTADNAREDPYNAIYSRITTKSNTFTVHWKVQSLKKRVGSSPTTWTEYQDQTTSELRGSTLIERYIDPNATNIPDYATTPTAQPLSEFYKWRVAAENYFRP